MEGPRVRLVFEDGHMLSKSQKSRGLKRSWLLLRTQHRTISDLSSYLLHLFNLYHSCPRGLILSMDGFILPPFESISLLKDNDIICLRKNGSTSSDIFKIRNAGNLIEEVEVVDKQPLHAGAPLLLNGEFEKESGSCLSEPAAEEEEEADEDTLPHGNSSGRNIVCTKRSVPRKLQSLKKRKQCLVAADGVENDIHTEQVESCRHDGVQPRKSLQEKIARNVKSESDIKDVPKRARTSNKDLELTLSSERSNQLQEDGDEGIEDVVNKPAGTKKAPSRNARRKKAKRKWLQEMAKIQKKRPHANWYQELTKMEKKDVAMPSVNYKHAPVSTRGSGKIDPWEQFSEAQNATIAEVSRENCWNRGSSRWGSWSHGPLRISKF